LLPEIQDFLLENRQTNTAETIATDLAGLIKGIVLVDIYNRAAFSTDASIYRILPQCVAIPKDTADIVAVVKYAADNQIPIAPRGAGSGLAGESLTSGIVLDVGGGAGYSQSSPVEMGPQDRAGPVQFKSRGDRRRCCQ
jgi:hypothetical protein